MCARMHMCVCMCVRVCVCVFFFACEYVCVYKLHFHPCQCHPWQEEIQSHEEAEKKLQEQVQSLTSDVETQHGQLLACRQQIEQLKLEKEAFYKGEGGRGTHQGIEILIVNNN